MKKLILSLLLLGLFSMTLISCTDETADQDQELYSPDKEKVHPIGSND